jgi:hypothetical protein
MRKCMRISVFLLLAVLLQSASTKAAMPLPVAALKGGSDGYLYIPNASKIDATGKTHIYYLKVDLWYNGTLLWCDQTGGTNPYYNATTAPRFWSGANWPSGDVKIDDVVFEAQRVGSSEGNSNFSYMADCVLGGSKDRNVDGNETNITGGNFGKPSGNYSSNVSAIHVIFNTGQDIPVNSSGYAPVPPGEVNFTVYNGTTPVMALTTFYNTTSPPPANLINSVTLNSPQTDTVPGVGQTFLMNCTSYTDDSKYGININFEYNYTGNPNFVDIPTTGSLLTANATGQVNVRNNTMYSRLITIVGGNDYYVRCRLYNSTTNMTSSVQRVSARYPPNLVIAEFRLYQSSDYQHFGTGTHVCDITSTYGSSIPNSNCSNSSFYENGLYRAEFEVCNDQLFGKNASVTGLVHGNLTSAYIGNYTFYTICETGSDTSGTGSGSLDPILINWDWNTTVLNGLYMNTTSYGDGTPIPPLMGNKVANTRTGDSCRWYVYYFKPYAVVNDTWVVSNATTLGASGGANPQVGGLSILLYTIANITIAEFRLYQSSDMTAVGSGTQVCNISSSYGSSIPDNSTCTGLTSITQYRAEMRVCYDWPQPGKNVTITGVVHGNLSSSYIWNTTPSNWGGCASGNGTLTPINCDWNTTVPNAVYINATTAPQFTTGNRNATSCQWYAYSFTTALLLNSTAVISNASTRGVSSGINPQVSGLSISITPQSSINGVTLNPPAADLNVTDLSNFAMTCTPSTNGGFNINVTFEYNSTTRGWAAIPAAGANFTIDGNNPEVNVSNLAYAHTVSVGLNSFGTYWIRCRINNATTSLYSSIKKIGVYPGVLNITLQNPSPSVYNSSNPFVTGQDNTFLVNASVTCSSNGTQGGCGSTSCSVRYNSSSASADTMVNETLGAKPFYVTSANMTHDFTGVSPPSTTHQALYAICSYGMPNFTPPSTIITTQMGVEPNTTGYISLSSEDGVESSYPFNVFNTAVCQQFRFQVNESTAFMKKINIHYKGHSSANWTTTSSCDTASYLTRLYIWNFTSNSWSLIGNSTSNFSDVIAAEFNSNFGSIVNSNYVYLLAASDVGKTPCWRNISTDYVRVDVQLTNKSVLPCGNLSANQTCKFSWLLNATGVNELRTVDVNCSSNKSTVTPADTGDAYVYIRGVEIHTDKTVYRNCGVVWYKVRSYALDNTPFDQNLTVSVYDPKINLMNQSKVQTAGGAYSGVYMLQPGAMIGEWLIRAFSCGVFNKTFGVGIGNVSDFWKAEWQMQDRVRFSASEKVTVVIRFYNQLGESRNVLGPWVFLDGSLGTCDSIATGQYDCSVNAPSTPGTHSINIFSANAGGRVFNETRYFYVGG